MSRCLWSAVQLIVDVREIDTSGSDVRFYNSIQPHLTLIKTAAVQVFAFFSNKQKIPVLFHFKRRNMISKISIEDKSVDSLLLCSKTITLTSSKHIDLTTLL